MAMTVMYNGVQFAPVSCKMSIVVPHQAEVVWSVVGKFGKQALWMGTVEGQPIFTQLLGGETADYVGAARVFGIADKLLFEQLTRLDNQEMLMCWQLMTHPMNSNPFPAAFVNCKASLQVFPVSIPGGSALVEWRIALLTEQHHVAHMTKAIDDIMIVGLTNLIKFMNKSSAHSSGGHSSTGTAVRTGTVGSLHAPSSYGVQYMPQPTAPQNPLQTQPLHQGMPPGALTGNSTSLQQPTFVPAPGESLDSSNMPSQAAPDASAVNHQQQPQQQHAHMYDQQQYLQQLYYQQQQQQQPGVRPPPPHAFHQQQAQQQVQAQPPRQAQQQVQQQQQQHAQEQPHRSEGKQTS